VDLQRRAHLGGRVSQERRVLALAAQAGDEARNGRKGRKGTGPFTRTGSSLTSARSKMDTTCLSSAPTKKSMAESPEKQSPETDRWMFADVLPPSIVRNTCRAQKEVGATQQQKRVLWFKGHPLSKTSSVSRSQT
jgi:hypothetical protein